MTETWTCSSPTTPWPTSFSSTTETESSQKLAPRLELLLVTREVLDQEWVSMPPTTTATDGRTCFSPTLTAKCTRSTTTTTTTRLTTRLCRTASGKAPDSSAAGV